MTCSWILNPLDFLGMLLQAWPAVSYVGSLVQRCSLDVPASCDCDSVPGQGFTEPVLLCVDGADANHIKSIC